MQKAVMSTVLSFIEPLITAVLGRYIEGDIAKCLLFHRWGIEFKSENVKMKNGALDELGLPISVKKGFLNLLHITITYTFHIEVNVKGFFLLIYPQHSWTFFDHKSNQRQKNAIKRSLLHRAEQRMLETEWSFLSKSMSYGESFVRGILKHFVRNFTMNCSDVHIRYQDVTTIPNHSFVFGITIKKMTITNTKQQNEEKYDDDNDENNEYLNQRSHNFLDNYLMENISSSESESECEFDIDDISNATETQTGGNSDPELDKKVITKVINLEGMSVYNNIMTNDKSKKDIIWHFDAMSDDEIRKKFEFIPSKTLRISSYKYLLKPFDIGFNVYLHENFRGYIEKYPNDPSKWRPNIECDISIDCIDLFVSTTQIFAILEWSKNWQFIKKGIKYHQLIEEMKPFRPKSTKNKKIWWQYLIQCAMKKDKNLKGERQFKLSNIINFALRKNRYIELYKRKMRPYKYRYWLPALDAFEKKELSKIEIEFPFSQILMFRSLGIAELKKEMSKRDLYQQRIKEEKDAANNSMFSKLFQGAVSMIASPEEAPNEYALSEAEERMVLNETDFIKQIEENMQYPDEYTEVHFGLFLDEINVQLKDDKNENIALFQVGVCQQFDMRPNSYLSQIGLQKVDLCLGDKRNLMNGSLLKALITPICAQIDIETDSVDINKNKIRIHNVGVIELMLNPQIINSNARTIEKLAMNIKQIVNKQMGKEFDVIPIDFDNDIDEREKKNEDDNEWIIEMNDVLMMKTKDGDLRYFVALNPVHSSCAFAETTIAGNWVVFGANEENDTDVFVKDTNRNGDVAVVRLKNLMRNEKNQYLRICTKKNKEKDQWIVLNKGQLVNCLKNEEGK